MKLNSITLKNFLAHSGAEFAFDSITSFLGPNGSGKTSILDALLFALTGRQRRPLVADGEKSGQVSLLVNDGIVIDRSLTASGTQTLNVSKGDAQLKGTNTEKQAALLQQLGVTEAQIDAALITGNWLSLPDKERKAVLFDALNLAPTDGHVKKWITENYPDVNPLPIITDLIAGHDLTDTEAMRKEAEGARREAKGALGEVSAALDRFVDVDMNVPGDQKKSKALLAELEAERQQLYEAKGARGNVAVLRADLVEIQKKIEAAGNVNGDDTKKAQKAVEKLTGEVERTQAILDELTAKRSDLRAQIVSINQRKEKAETIGDTCPTCGKKMAKASREKMVAEIDKEHKEAAELLATVDADYNETAENLDEYRTQFADAQAKIKANTTADVAALEERAAELEQKIAAMEGEPDPQDDIDKLTARIEKGRDLIAKLEARDSAREKVGELEERAEELKGAVERWDIVAKAFGSKGVPAMLLRQAVETLKTTVSKYAEPAGFSDIDFHIEEGARKEAFRVIVNGRPEESLSGAESHALAVVMQAVIAELTGLKLLVVDELNLFVGEHRAAVNGLLLKVGKVFDSVVLLGALADAPAAPKVDGFTLYWLGPKKEAA